MEQEPHQQPDLRQQNPHQPQVEDLLPQQHHLRRAAVDRRHGGSEPIAVGGASLLISVTYI